MNNCEVINDIQTFTYSTQPCRVIERDGETWWVLADVCDALNLSTPHKVAERLDNDEKGRSLIPTLGGQQEVVIINEAGLYNVILRSDKPEAKSFKRWVTHEVLPQIRRTGSYIAQYGTDEVPTLRLKPKPPKKSTDTHVISVRHDTYETVKNLSERTGVPQIDLYSWAVAYFLSRAKITE